MSFADSRGPHGEVMMDRSVSAGWSKICKTNNEYNKFDGAIKQTNISAYLPSAFFNAQNTVEKTTI